MTAGLGLDTVGLPSDTDREALIGATFVGPEVAGLLRGWSCGPLDRPGFRARDLRRWSIAVEHGRDAQGSTALLSER